MMKLAKTSHQSIRLITVVLSLVPRLDSPAIVIVMYSGEIEKKTQCKTNSMGKAQHSDQ